MGVYLSASLNNWSNWILEYVLGLLGNLMAIFALKYPMTYWKNINTVHCCQASEDTGKRPTKKCGKAGGPVSLSYPLSAPGFKGAKSCCIRALQLSHLHLDSSLSPVASPHSQCWKHELDASWPLTQTLVALSPQSRTWVSLHSSLSAPGDPPEMLSVTYHTRVVFSLTNTFSIFVGKPEESCLHSFCHPIWYLCAAIITGPLWVLAAS